jgi:tyrosyl-tRNA synthetase
MPDRDAALSSSVTTVAAKPVAQSSIGPMPDSTAEAVRLAANAVDVLPEGALEKQLELGRPLRVKLGIDPTMPDIHLGHTVVLSKLREFQDAGHVVVLIIGDFTARVGDPSGRSAQRPVLSDEQIGANVRTYEDQAFKVLDRGRTEVRRNSEWLDMEAGELLGVLSRGTVARLMERDIFQRRIEADEAITVLELIYPLLQGYDSVAIDADIELGGTDQKFNLLFARDVQVAYGKPPQAIITMPLLVGTDGVQKMSKSLDNYVGVTDPPEEMFGRLMSIPDDLMPDYFRLLLSSEVPETEPNEAKRELARRIVERYHDAGAAKVAEEHFDRLHVRHELPEEIEEAKVASDGPLHLPALLADLFGLSRSEARRLIEQGGVKIDERVVDGDQLDIPTDGLDGAVVQVGKRRHKRLRVE